MNEDIKQYINKMRLNGKSNDEIIWHLFKVGWKEEELIQFFPEIKEKKKNINENSEVNKKKLTFGIISFFIGIFLLSLTASRSDDLGVILVYIIAFPLAFFGLASIIFQICINSLITKIFSSVGFIVIALAIAGEQISKNAEEQYARWWVHEYYGFYVLIGITLIIPIVRNNYKKIPSYFIKKLNLIKQDNYAVVKKLIKNFYKKWWFYVLLIILLLWAGWSILVPINDDKFNMDDGPKRCDGITCSIDLLVFKLKCYDRGGDYFSPQDNYSGIATCGLRKYEFVTKKNHPSGEFCISSDDCVGLCVYYNESPDINEFQCQLYRLGGPAYFTTIEEFGE